MAILGSVGALGFRHGEGSPWLFRGLSFDLHTGTALVVMGPSGCGKSTLLRLLGGMVKPTEGQIEWTAIRDRHAIGGNTGAQSFIGAALMFQEPRLLPWRTAAQNIAFGIEQLRLPEQMLNHRIERALQKVGLAGLGARYPAQLSGGQQQRVALARAMATGSRVLLLDEPFSALDPETHRKLVEIIRDLIESGISVVLVSHNPEDSRSLGGNLLDLGSSRPQVVYPQLAGEKSLVA